MRTFLIVILLLLSGAAGWFAGSTAASRKPATLSPNAEEQLAQRAVEKIRGIGKLEPHSGIVKIMAPQGQKIDSLFSLQVGEEVKIGQPIVKLSAGEIRELELKVARAKKKDADNQLAYEKSKGELKKQAANLALDEARSIRSEIRLKTKSVEVLQRRLEIASEQLERLENLKSNIATQSMIGTVDLDKQELVVRQLDSTIHQAREEIKLAIGKADRAEQAAELELQTVEFMIRESKSSIPYATLNSAIQAAEKAVEMTEITAPIDGIVLDIIVRPGDTVTNQPVMLIGNTDKIVCVAEINDTQLRDIQVNDKATISCFALNVDIEGHVISKGIMIGPPSMKDPNPFASVDRKTGRVVIQLHDISVAKDYINLQVDVEIEVSSATEESPGNNVDPSTRSSFLDDTNGEL